MRAAQPRYQRRGCPVPTLTLVLTSRKSGQRVRPGVLAVQLMWESWLERDALLTAAHRTAEAERHPPADTAPKDSRVRRQSLNGCTSTCTVSHSHVIRPGKRKKGSRRRQVAWA